MAAMPRFRVVRRTFVAIEHHRGPGALQQRITPSRRVMPKDPVARDFDAMIEPKSPHF
jgi:hypothetical protein